MPSHDSVLTDAGDQIVSAADVIVDEYYMLYAKRPRFFHALVIADRYAVVIRIWDKFAAYRVLLRERVCAGKGRITGGVIDDDYNKVAVRLSAQAFEEQ